MGIGYFSPNTLISCILTLSPEEEVKQDKIAWYVKCESNSELCNSPSIISQNRP